MGVSETDSFYHYENIFLPLFLIDIDRPVLLEPSNKVQHNISNPNISKATMKIHKGSTKTIICSTEGNPAVTYRWLKNGKIISNSPTLTFNNINLGDDGFYKCIAENAAGTEDVIMEVIVQCKFFLKLHGSH